MRFTNGLRTGMKFVSPKQYTASNEAHFVINSNAVNQLTKMYSAVSNNHKVLDFGCGTGETTHAMAKGELGNLGRPESVMGLDISKDMIDHCASNYSAPNLKWRQMDVESKECQSFCSEQNGKMDLVTSFSCLHWVPNQPAAVQMFNRVLSPGGKFCFVIASTQNSQRNVMKKEFEKMKREDKWSSMLNKTSWPHFKTVHRNNTWMSTVDHKGNGPIIERDYIKLMENNGFKVGFSKSQSLNYVFHDDFIRNFFKSTILTSFNELEKNEREMFLNEFVTRLKSQKQLNADGHYEAHVDGFLIMGEKERNI